MTSITRTLRRAGGALVIVALGACSNAGTLGNILGGVLGGGGGGNQVSGVVRGVDARAQQIVIQQSDGSNVALNYDAQTQVVYQNQQYSVSSLESGDQVTARVQSGQNGGYYTDLVQVDQPRSGRGGATGTGGNVQNVEGRVRQIDTVNGLFALEVANYGVVTVSLPYNVTRADQNRFQSLRAGDYVRLAGVFLNNTRVELRQFY
ncbi:MAG TPA: hypothetical protein VHM30_01700 [Gemmatimonadaceae bacterium]|nr:hypothetical protein [Gemmatimonadaceae bacterium]